MISMNRPKVGSRPYNSFFTTTNNPHPVGKISLAWFLLPSISCLAFN